MKVTKESTLLWFKIEIITENRTIKPPIIIVVWILFKIESERIVPKLPNCRGGFRFEVDVFECRFPLL